MAIDADEAMQFKATSSWISGRAAVLAATGAVMATTLTGCEVPRVQGYIDVGNVNVAGHSVPFWRLQQDYYVRFSHEDPSWINGGTVPVPFFNSCMDTKVDALSVCNRRGRCMPFDPNDIEKPIFFCKCDQDWGGPECGVRRKRQSVAWMWSLFGGPLGLDEMYLGWPLQAIAKIMVTLLAAFVWRLTGHYIAATTLLLVPWLTDVVRIGSAPVRAKNYRVSEDLDNWTFATFTLLHFLFVAFILGVAYVYITITRKRAICDYQKYYGTNYGASSLRASMSA